LPLARQALPSKLQLTELAVAEVIDSVLLAPVADELLVVCWLVVGRSRIRKTARPAKIIISGMATNRNSFRFELIGVRLLVPNMNDS
jgi:hypothetical protein